MKPKILQLGAVTILAAAVLLSSCGRTTSNSVSEEGTTTSGAAGSTSESVSGGHSSLEASSSAAVESSVFPASSTAMSSKITSSQPLKSSSASTKPSSAAAQSSSKPAASSSSSAAAKPQEPNDTDDMSSVQLKQAQQDILRLVNEEREKTAAAPLKLHEQLCRAAQLRAEETTVLFEHTRPDQTSCFTVLEEFGITNYQAAGENIAWGESYLGTAENIMIGWMNSPGHKANILKAEFTHLGVGCVEKDGTWYWVQLFLTPADSQPA